jgi:hypothetical protein
MNEVTLDAFMRSHMLQIVLAELAALAILLLLAKKRST